MFWVYTFSLGTQETETMTTYRTHAAATSLGHAIARDWAGRHYSAADLATGFAIASRGKVITQSPRVVFGKKGAK